MGGVFSRLLVEVQVQGAEPEELDRHSAWLADELLQLDVDGVERAPSPVPAGAKASAGYTAGMLIVSVSNSALAVALTGVLRSWISRGSGRKVTVRLGDDVLEISRASASDQAELIAAWLGKHGGE
jgi:hypothetical protein